MSTTTSHRGPYKGLKPFAEEDASFFFGRATESDTLVTNLMASRLTVLYGPPGGGKSSVLNAGVVPHLRKLAARYTDSQGTPEFAVVIFSSWRREPARELVNRVRETLLNEFQHVELEADLSTLNEALSTFTERLKIDLFVILDQFEEYFVYHPGGEAAGSFVAEFADAVKDDSLRVNFLISIRDDWLAKLDRFKDDLPNLFDNYLRLQDLSQEDAREAIEKPIRVYATMVDPRADIEKALVNQILADLPALNSPFIIIEDELGGEPGHIEVHDGALPIQASYLQLLMYQLWEREASAGSHFLSMRTLKALGGVRGVAGTHVGNLLDGLSSEEQDIAGRIFHMLVSARGTKYAQPLSFLSDRLEEWQKESLVPLLNKLSGSNFFLLRQGQASDSEEDPVYEISHDLLAPAILQWLVKYDLQKKEQGRIKEKKDRFLFPTLLLLGLVIAAALWSSYQSLRNNYIAQSRGLAAQANRLLPQNRNLSLLLAYEAYRISPTVEAEEALRNALRGSLEDGTAIFTFEESIAGVEGDPQVTSAALSRDGQRALTLDNSGQTRIWTLRPTPGGQGFPAQARKLGTNETVLKAAFSADGKRVVMACADSIARVWDVESTGPPLELKGHTRPVLNASFSPDGQSVVTVSDDKTAIIWTVKDGKEKSKPISLSQQATVVAFYPDGINLMFANDKGDVWAWGKALSLKAHRRAVNSITFSPDGKLFVTASSDKTARVWSAETGELVAELNGHTDVVNSAAFSLDSELIITASNDGTARAWEAKTGASIRELLGHRGLVLVAMFAADASVAFTVGDDKTMRSYSKYSFVPFGIILDTARHEIEKENLKLNDVQRQKYLHEQSPKLPSGDI